MASARQEYFCSALVHRARLNRRSLSVWSVGFQKWATGMDVLLEKPEHKHRAVTMMDVFQIAQKPRIRAGE